MKKEAYEERCKMAEMHDDFKKRLDQAYTRKEYVEASWLCYAIFEQRIQRLIEKHIHRCPRRKRTDTHPVGIKTKIQCIRKLSKVKYGGYADFNMRLLDDISKWCDKRNELVHSLLNVSTYRQYDKDFYNLAKEGLPLVEQLYSEASKIRAWYYAETFGAFPEIKCRCTQRCIFEKSN